MIILITLVCFISSYHAECKELPNRVSLIILNSTPTTTHLKWRKPTNIGGILRYEVKYKQIEELYYTLSIHMAAKSLVIDSLSPSTTYFICVSAINEVGRGPANCITVKTKDLSIPKPVDFIVVNSSPSTLFLKWGNATNGSIISHYKVTYTQKDQALTTFSQQMVKNSLTIRSLSPGTNYLICLYAINQAGKSPATCKTVVTKIDANVPKPVDFIVVNSSPTTLLLQWRNATADGNVSHYKVIYKQIDQAPTTFSQQIMKTSLTISSLSARTNYLICLYAINRAGESRPTCKIVATKGSG